jgi:putative ABC transport system permease protein
VLGLIASFATTSLTVGSWSPTDSRPSRSARCTCKKQGTILLAFTSLTIFISCLGLFGLVTFTAAQRTKEIGIRKVLGASVTSIVSVLIKDLLKLVIISLLIASPIAWFITNNWLEAFAYRISLSWWIYGIAGVSALLIATLTICFQAIKAAIANPVKSLKAE